MMRHFNKLRMTGTFSWQHWLGVAFLGLQLLAIARARFVPERFFCWAPYDEHTRYRISVEIAGRSLESSEIASRYRYDDDGWEVRSIHNVISLVRQYEETYGSAEDAKVTIDFTVNARLESVWKWPEQ